MLVVFQVSDFAEVFRSNKHRYDKKERTLPTTALPMTHPALHERGVTVPEKRHPPYHPCAVQQGLSRGFSVSSTSSSARCRKPSSQCAEGLRRTLIFDQPSNRIASRRPDRRVNVGTSHSPCLDVFRQTK